MPPRAFVLAVSLIVVLATGPGAWAAGAGTGLTDNDKPVSIFVGVAVGTDSNVGRAHVDVQSDAVTQLLAGAALTAGNERNRFDLRAQYRQDTYAKLEDLSFDETRVSLFASTGTDRVRFKFVGAHEKLVDPTDFSIVELLERTRTLYAPTVDFDFGKMGLGLGYSAGLTDYEDARYDRLDLEEEAWTVEFRWSPRQTTHVFVHYEAADVDYIEALPLNFERQRVYLGVRAESRSRSGFEIGLGTDAVPKYGVSAELYAVLRGTMVVRGGRSGVEVAVTHGTEAAPDADFKRATRFLLRYTHRASRRLRWNLALSGENDDIVHPTATSDPLLHTSLDAGLDLELGSPGGKVHGRLFLTLGQESRKGRAAADDYSRFRFFAGIALVH